MNATDVKNITDNDDRKLQHKQSIDYIEQIDRTSKTITKISSYYPTALNTWNSVQKILQHHDPYV